ncbi:hypothetical protein NDU88_010854 [Pleurodeles waltl]|uniref:Uncharacterized protein n=1 Tax=Pleurodeles waltl TaxID=8319 RepID=A0AAV7Q3E9_PLEWA|nr:hypothetical protein NDU88_010854 [Pleurodeles waltl]
MLAGPRSILRAATFISRETEIITEKMKRPLCANKWQLSPGADRGATRAAEGRREQEGSRKCRPYLMTSCEKGCRTSLPFWCHTPLSPHVTADNIYAGRAADAPMASPSAPVHARPCPGARNAVRLNENTIRIRYTGA